MKTPILAVAILLSTMATTVVFADDSPAAGQTQPSAPSTTVDSSGAAMSGSQSMSGAQSVAPSTGGAMQLPASGQ